MIFILTGPVHSGKTTLLRRAVEELKEKKLQVGGFLSEVILKNDKVLGYDLVDLKQEKSFPFIRREGEKMWPSVGSFYFIPKSLAEASKIILRSGASDILVVDEVGPLELSGKGLWPYLNQVIFEPKAHYLLVVRENIIEDFLKLVGKGRARVFHVEDEEACSRLVDEIMRALSVRRRSSTPKG